MGAVKAWLLANGFDNPSNPQAREAWYSHIRFVQSLKPKEGGAAMTAQKPQAQTQGRDPIAERQARAWQALLEGAYQVLPRSFLVRNGDGKTYVVGLVPEPKCTCPDHNNRGIKCKHLWAVEALVRALWPEVIVQQHPQETELQHPANQQQKPQTQTVIAQEPPQNPPDDPGDYMLASGKHAGKTLRQIWKEDPGYIRWMATSLHAPGGWSDQAKEFLRRHHPEALQSRPSTQDRRNGKKPFTMGFGKHKGKTLEQIAQEDPDYIRWLAENYQPKDGYGRAIQRKAQSLLRQREARTRLEATTVEEINEILFG